MMNVLSFLPGTNPPPALPLRRFLPPLPEGMVSAWLKQNVKPGGWVLDPLGASPLLALEAARAGYRILITINNPVVSFMLETLAQAFPADTYQAALSELGAVRRGDTRLEVQLQSLYQTRCLNCGEAIPVEGYLWRREDAQNLLQKAGEGRPFARIYHCSYCQAEGEHPLDPVDLERLKLPGSDSLHRARALERINLGQENLSEGAREAISTYLPRPLYALFTILNKLEGLNTTRDRLQCLQALALSALDEGSALWPWPTARTRPRQITMPPQFRENNLWLALENAVQSWSSSSTVPVPLVYWPELPPESGGISLVRGRIRSLWPLPPSLPLEAVVTVFPRPSQAFWMLSAIWAGWLWGKNAVQPMKSALERQRYDWQWHTNALHLTLGSLHRNTPPTIPLFGLAPEIGPGFLAAILSAAEAAGYHLHGLALRRETEFIQMTWKQDRPLVQRDRSRVDEVCTHAIQDCLVQRNEPAHYLQVFTAALAAQAAEGLLPFDQSELPPDHLTFLQRDFSRVINQKSIFHRFDVHGQSDETGWWWLMHPPAVQQWPLTDQLEKEIVNFLHKHRGRTLAEIDTEMCQRFQGLLTPAPDLLLAILHSYGETMPEDPSRWQVKEQELATNRQEDIESVRRTIQAVGFRLGYISQGSPVLAWLNPAGEAVSTFYPIASSIVSRFLLNPGPVSGSKVIVLPGSRANLLALKLERDQRLAKAASAWHFIKFRHLRQLSENPDLTPELWNRLLDSDPPRWEEATQMTFFNI